MLWECAVDLLVLNAFDQWGVGRMECHQNYYQTTDIVLHICTSPALDVRFYGVQEMRSIKQTNHQLQDFDGCEI